MENLNPDNAALILLTATIILTLCAWLAYSEHLKYLFLEEMNDP